MIDERKSETTITAAAIRLPDGTVICLPPPARHHDVVRRALADGHAQAEVFSADQGFLTSEPRYVNRKIAWPIADVAGQLTRLPGGTEGLLFSENLW